MRSARISLVGILAAAVLAATGAGSETEWPGWRGPTRDGVASDVRLPASWPEQLRALWSVEVGEGQSSPIVAAGRVYVHSRQQDREIVRCLTLADGEIEWESEPEEVPFKINPGVEDHGKGPKATPAFAAGRLFTVSVAGTVTAWDAAEGVSLWRHNADGALPPAFGGAGVSPLVVGKRLVVHLGDAKTGALRALSVTDGRLLWSWEEDGAGYASPIVVTVGGRPQVVTQSAAKLVGVDLETGQGQWELPYETHNFQNIVTPLAVGDLVVFSGVQAPTIALRLRAGDSPEEVWRNRRLSMYMSSPVTADGALFGMAHQRRGQFFALDAKTGEVLWTTRGREGENTLLARAGDALFWLTAAGRLVVTAVSRDEFTPLADYRVADSATWSHPALTGSVILIKDETKLTAWTWE